MAERGNINVLSKQYWNIEKRIKILESKAGVLFGLSGCMYAVRKEICPFLKQDIMEDLGRPLIVFSKGYLNIFEKDARCYEYTVLTPQEEIEMRQRVITRTLYTLYRLRSLLNPLKYPKIFLAVLTHKILRYAVPFLCLILLLYSIVTVQYFPAKLYIISLIYAIVSFALVTCQRRKTLYTSSLSRFLAPGYYFVLYNLAVIKALKNIFRRNNAVYWQTQR